jgi:heparinase II/III-like protein
MSAREILWRISGKIQDASDRSKYRSRRDILPVTDVFTSQNRDDWFRPTALNLPDATDPNRTAMSTEWARRVAGWTKHATEHANRIADHKLSFFDFNDVDLGHPIRWNFELKADRPTPTGFAGDIDYRDHRVTGDCKFVWEPNRHHQFVVLASAYRLTGDDRYAQAAVDQMESWIDDCPFGTGMNWRSPLELGIRIINWTWTIELIRYSKALTADRLDRITAVAYRHLWDIARKYSKHSSANNHLIGEAAGVFIGSSYFSGMRHAANWRNESRDILIREIFAQSHPDGGNREQAFGYHSFVLQFYLLAAIVARNTGQDFPPEYWERLEKMFEFTAQLHEAGSSAPNFGDADDGYVLDLGGPLGRFESLMCVAAILFNRDDFKTLAGEFREPAYWLLGSDGRDRFESIVAESERTLSPRAFPETGYYLLQNGSTGHKHAVSVGIDCGELGFGAIAAHGHADALSLTLRVGGHDILIDPGTYDYFTYPDWRMYFKSTRAHNTVEVDGCDQSELLGSFLWGRRAETKCLAFDPTQTEGQFIGEHDGYTRLADPVVHRRTVDLKSDGSQLHVIDDILANQEHDIRQSWHFSPDCKVNIDKNHRVTITHTNGDIVMLCDDQFELEIVHGSENPIMGWTSTGYHTKHPSPTLVCRCRCKGTTRFQTQFTLTTRHSDADCFTKTDTLDQPICS